MNGSIKINQWLQHLNRQKLPNFAETTKTLAYLTRHNSASATDLAKVILQDATLSSKVLKMVNSTVFNPSSKRIDTISHAIVLLGIDRIRNLAITASFLEDILRPGHLHQVQKQTIEAFQAAVLARRLDDSNPLGDGEEIYIAALFQRLGHILYWCFPNQKTEQLIERIGDNICHDGEETDILEFSFQELTSTLIKQWHLSNLTLGEHDSVQAQHAKQCIELAYAITTHLPHGWHHPATQNLVEVTAAFLDASDTEAKVWLVEQMQLANHGLLQLKIDPKFLPAVPLLDTPKPIEKPTNDTKKHTRPSPVTAGSGMRLLMHLLNGPIDLEYLQLALLECLRTDLLSPYTFILTRKGKEQRLILKHYIGKKSALIAQQLIGYIESTSTISELERLMASHFPFYCSLNSLDKHYPESKILGPNYLCYPLVADDICLGYLFAVRDSHDKISEELFDLFCHYCEHGNLAYRLALTKHLTKQSRHIP